MQFSIFEEDLLYIKEKIANLLPKLQDKHFFITGANGFFGIWLMESLLYLNKKHNANISIYALTRSEHEFYKKFPHLQNAENLNVIEGTVLSYGDNFAKLDYIIHAANLPDTKKNDWATKHILYGTVGLQNIFATAKKHNVQAVLLTSSGAVYNNFHKNDVCPYAEDDVLINCSEQNVYARTKRIMEQLAQNFYAQEKIPVAVARCFALAGAYLPLENFAFGNFIKNALHNEQIIIKGSGLNKRSYMYASDLILWLLVLLLEAKNYQAYNVGSDYGVTVSELANLVAKKYNLNCQVLNQDIGGNAPRDYIAVTSKAQKDLGLKCSIGLDEAIEKTYNWYKEIYAN